MLIIVLWYLRRDCMECIKFYSEHDMLSETNIRNIVELVNQFNDNSDEDDINKILEYFNIIKFYTLENFKNIIITETEGRSDEVLRTIKKKIGRFIGVNMSNKFLNLYENVDINYKEDFFELIDKYNIYENIEKSDFEYFLKNSDLHYSVILKYIKIVNNFDKVLREHILQDNTSAEVFLRKYFYNVGEKKNEIFLPLSLTEQDKEKIILNYIEYEYPNINYLEMIINFPSNSEFKIGDKLKLKAKRRYKEEIEKLFDGKNGIETGVEIKYPENQEETVIYSMNGMIWECSVSRSWIENNLDFNTLWNNFIYIFEFFDLQMRLNLVSKLNEMGIFERFTRTKSNHLYKDLSIFKHKDRMSTIQIYSYVQVLNNYKIRIEEMIEWFFNKYLSDEFGINNYIVKMPTKSSSNFEKCRAVLPEIDSILKQYKLYLDDGEIDQELLQVSSSHMFFKDCISCVDKKYVYPMKGIFDRASFLLFSDQSSIFYLSKLSERYNNFFDLLSCEKVKLKDFYEYQIKRIEWLIENNFVCEDNNGDLRFVNHNRIILFRDLYYNEAISYWNCEEKLRDEIDTLVNENVLKFDNKLFTKGEQDYFDYHLNKAKFSNSLDLRNSYLHGTQTNDAELHKMNYLIFLKLIVIIIVKINDDLCAKIISDTPTLY